MTPIEQIEDAIVWTLRGYLNADEYDEQEMAACILSALRAMPLELRLALADNLAPWQPIEESPKDGRVVELYRSPPDSERGVCWASRVNALWHDFGEGEPPACWIWPDDICVDIFDVRRREWIGNGDFHESVGEFTHWRPLPAPPKKEG